MPPYVNLSFFEGLAYVGWPLSGVFDGSITSGRQFHSRERMRDCENGPGITILTRHALEMGLLAK
jgi:hypothetical protein